MIKPSRFLRFITGFTKVSAWLGVVGGIVLALLLFSTLVSPTPVLFRLGRQEALVGGSGLVVTFEFEEEKDPGPNFVYGLVASLPVIAANSFIMFRLHRILQTVLAGTPYVATNVGDIRAMAYALFVIPLFSSLAANLQGFSTYELLKDVPGIVAATRWQWDMTGVGTGTLLLILAEVFRLGVAMKEDEDLTI